MDFLFDPAIWAGLVTLIVLEIVLGIDNLVFVAILAKKLPLSQQKRAINIGLGLALLMRLVLLSVMSWLVSLTQPLFHVWEHPFSARDLILLIGGLFLLYKATMELHERLEARPHTETQGKGNAGFWLVISQILLLDAVFSLDSIITAVGMVDELGVMMAAVIIAMGVMVAASRPLTNFVARHPTVVVLCLSFLLMIGLSLVAEGLGFHIPKGYLYAAIGFSILIEMFNQIAHRNSVKHEARKPFRERTTMAIVRMMSTKQMSDTMERARNPKVTAEEQSFGQEERNMVEGVLTLAERSVKSIMTPRSEIVWINVEDDWSVIEKRLKDAKRSYLPVCNGSLDEVIGVVKGRELINIHSVEDLIAQAKMRQPMHVPETIHVLRLMREFRQVRSNLVLITDEFGIIQGLATPHDVLEAIAGDFPDEGEVDAMIKAGNGWEADGTLDLFQVEQSLNIDNLRPEDEQYSTIAGLVFDRLGRFPAVGDVVRIENLKITVLSLDAQRIDRVRLELISKKDETQEV